MFLSLVAIYFGLFAATGFSKKKFIYVNKISVYHLIGVKTVEKTLMGTISL